MSDPTQPGAIIRALAALLHAANDCAPADDPDKHDAWRALALAARREYDALAASTRAERVVSTPGVRWQYSVGSGAWKPFPVASAGPALPAPPSPGERERGVIAAAEKVLALVRAAGTTKPATPDHIQLVWATLEQIDAFNMNPGQQWVIYFEHPETGERAQTLAVLSPYPGVRHSRSERTGAARFCEYEGCDQAPEADGFCALGPGHDGRPAPAAPQTTPAPECQWCERDDGTHDGECLNAAPEGTTEPQPNAVLNLSLGLTADGRARLSTEGAAAPEKEDDCGE